MKALIKDLRHTVNMVIGNEMHPVKDRYIIKYSASVVIKRDGEFYEVPIMMTEEVELGDLFEGINRAWLHFEEHCDKVSSNWKLVDEELDSPNGKIIGQKKIEL